MNKAVLFLEPKGTVLEVIRAAKKRGYAVIALSTDRSYLEHAPAPYNTAVALIDRTIQISSWQGDGEVFQICNQLDTDYRIEGIFFGLDPCAVIAAKLRQRYGLPTTSPEDFELILDKFRLRRHLVSLGLSKIKNYSAREVEEWTSWKLAGSGYFKPIHGLASAYVSKCTNLVEVRAAAAQFQQGDPSDPQIVRNYITSGGGYHLEESFEGELLSVEAICQEGKFHCLGLLSRILYSKNSTVEMGSCFPYPHPYAEQIIKLVEEVHRKVKFTDGPTHTEVIVNAGGEVEVIDLNPRFVGADVLQSINYAYDTQIEDVLLDATLRHSIRTPFSVRRYSCLQYFLPPKIDVLESAELPISLSVPFKTVFLSSGTPLKSHDRQLDYIGCYLTLGDSFEEAMSRSFQLRSSVRINKDYPGVF